MDGQHPAADFPFAPPSTARDSALAVVKLGGSLSESPHLPRWLAALAAHGGGRVVVVPGGGPFADAVRRAQARWAFSDAAAHRMALAAMAQYGRLLAALRPELVPAESEPELRAVLTAGRVPVWLPEPMAAGDPAVPESWDVTSDSLAAWLARRLGAGTLILVKSCRLAPSATAAELAAAGVVDRAFPDFAAGISVRLLASDRWDGLPGLLWTSAGRGSAGPR